MTESQASHVDLSPPAPSAQFGPAILLPQASHQEPQQGRASASAPSDPLPAASDGAHRAQALAFRAGRWRFLVDVHRVSGVLSRPSKEATTVGRPELTFIAWQGAAVPVFSLTALLAAEREPAPVAKQPEVPDQVLLLRAKEGVVGLGIDHAEQVVHLLASDCLAADAISQAPSRWCLGYSEVRGELYGLFDVRALEPLLP